MEQRLTESGLRGLRVLVVEDEALIVLLLEDMLAEMGCVIAAMASTLNEAMGAAESVTADLALLDVNVGGKEIFPVAEILAGRSIPMVFSTGYGAKGVTGRWSAYPVVTKPFDPAALQAALIAAKPQR